MCINVHKADSVHRGLREKALGLLQWQLAIVALTCFSFGPSSEKKKLIYNL